MGTGISKALAAVSILQAEFLAYGIKVTSTSPDNQTTHFGPTGHEADAGKEIRVTVTVRMLDDYGEDILSCGPLVGVQLPPPGAVKDVGIDWTSQDLTGVGPLGQVTQSLKAYGTITIEPADGKTGKDGTSTFIFRPNDEAGPPVGEVRTAHGTIFGLARYQSAFGNLPGSLAQYYTPKRVQRNWIVTYHKPRGYKFEHLTLDIQAGQAHLHWDYSGSICGPTPFGKVWNVGGTYTVTGPYPSSTQGTFQLTFPDSGALASFGSIDFSLTGGNGSPLQMNAHNNAPPGASGSAEITDDPSCPEML